MTDLAHSHAHNHAGEHAHALPGDHAHFPAAAAVAVAPRQALLAMAVGARLLLVAPVLVALWAGVYWALN